MGLPRWRIFSGNVFNNPVAAVEVMFYDLCLTVLGYISNLASAIQTLLNKIPGVEVDITSGLDGFYSKLEEAQQAVKDKSGWVEQVGKMDYVDYQTAYNKGYDFGQGVENKVFDFSDLQKFHLIHKCRKISLQISPIFSTCHNRIRSYSSVEINVVNTKRSFRT